MQNAVHADLQHAIEPDRHVAHRPQHIFAVERNRDDVGDRAAEGCRAADFLPGNEPDRCPSRDFIYSVGVPLHTIHFREAGNRIHRDRLMRHCVVAVDPVH